MTAAMLLLFSGTLSSTTTEYPWTQAMIVSYTKQKLRSGFSPAVVERSLIRHLEEDGFSAFPLRSFIRGLEEDKLHDLAFYIQQKFSYNVRLVVRPFTGPKGTEISQQVARSLQSRIKYRGLNDSSRWDPQIFKGVASPTFMTFAETEFAEAPGAIWETVVGKVSRTGGKYKVDVEVIGMINSYSVRLKKQRVESHALVSFSVEQRGGLNTDKIADLLLDKLNEAFGIKLIQ